jgi:hypothetical protein
MSAPSRTSIATTRRSCGARCDVPGRCSVKRVVHPGDFRQSESLQTNRSADRNPDGRPQECGTAWIGDGASVLWIRPERRRPGRPSPAAPDCGAACSRTEEAEGLENLLGMVNPGPFAGRRSTGGRVVERIQRTEAPSLNDPNESREQKLRPLMTRRGALNDPSQTPGNAVRR